MTKSYPARVRTIGDFIDRRYELSFHCAGPDCVGLHMIDLHVLAARVGRGFDFYATRHLPAAERLPVKCAKCGGRPAGFIVHPWTLPADAK